MQDIITVRDVLLRVINSGIEWDPSLKTELKALVADYDRQIEQYDHYVDQMALEHEKYEDKVECAA